MPAGGKGLAGLSAQRLWFGQSSLAARRDALLPLINPAEQLCVLGKALRGTARPGSPRAWTGARRGPRQRGAHSPQRAACLRRLGFLPRLREAQLRTPYEPTLARCQVSERNNEQGVTFPLRGRARLRDGGRARIDA